MSCSKTRDQYEKQRAEHSIHGFGTLAALTAKLSIATRVWSSFRVSPNVGQKNGLNKVVWAPLKWERILVEGFMARQKVPVLFWLTLISTVSSS
jgi:hypothetical protein